MFKVEKQRAFNLSNIKEVVNISSQIDFDPPYQRYGNIWTLDKKQLLIDSILNEYDIPKIYLHYITEYNSEINASGKPYAIIDGKQRLQAIIDFANGDFKLGEDFIYEKNPSINIARKGYKELANEYSEIKYEFDNFELDIVYIITNDIEKLEEFFYRLNEGQPLNNAEKRNRISGYINSQIKLIIANNEFFLKKFSSSRKRLQYEDLCLKLLYLEYHDEIKSFDKKDLDDFVESHRSKDANIEKAIISLKNNLNLLSTIFIDEDYLLKSRSIIPVYYYFIIHNVNKYDSIRAYLENFNDIIKLNRKQKTPNPILLEFDRQNQQGVHRLRSLSYRYEVITKYYTKFLEGVLDWSTKITLDNFNLDTYYDY